MMGGVSEFVGGRVTVFVPRQYAVRFMRMLIAEGITAAVRDGDVDEDGIRAELSPKNAKKIAAVLDIYSIKVYIINIKGSCALLQRVRRRWGAIVGAVLFFALIWISSLFVWRVDIVGAETLSHDALTESLAELGVGAGSRISRIDGLSVGNALMLKHPEIAWTSVDVQGTTVTVSLRETVEDEREERNDTSLLVASESGIVQSVLVYSGTAAVKPGSVVKAGDALINGLISGSGLQYSDAPILRVEKADGSVKALVERTVTVFVPYREEEKAVKQGGERMVGREITLFGATVRLGSRAPEGDYFVSQECYNVAVWGGARLPVNVKKTVWSEQESLWLERTPEEAEALARKRAEAEVTDGVGDGRLVLARYNAENGEEGCNVTAVYKCIVEITKPADVTSGG